MKLTRALRLNQSAVAAFVGGGGKTSAVFLAARETAPALVTTSTHLSARQAQHADRHIVWPPEAEADGQADRKTDGKTDRETGELTDTPVVDAPETELLRQALSGGVTLVTGPYREDIARVTAPLPGQMATLHRWAKRHRLPLFIEADGSRQRPLKAPAEHEPAIPAFAETVVVTAGMRGLDRPLDENFIHRPQIFGDLSGLKAGEIVDETAIIRVLTHPQGGLKNIPAGARRVVLLNQADTETLQARAGKMAASLLTVFDAVVIASVQRGEVHAVYERVAGIVLAAGEAARYGQPKQLLEFHGEPFVRRAAKTALSAGLWPVVVVTGAYGEAVENALRDLPVVITRNKAWQEGQSASLKAGLKQAHVPGGRVGAAIFLLADQPQVSVEVLQALRARHAQGLFPIVAPLVRDRRASPMLFDQDTFPALMELTGDTGGRALMRQFPVEYVPWHDETLLLDVDSEADYQRLLKEADGEADTMNG